MEGASQLIFFLLIAVVFWFLLIRPQRRRQQELAATQRAVEPGVEVMLGAGIFGLVTRVEDDFLELETGPGARMKVARAAVVRVVSSDEPPAGSAQDSTDLPTEVGRRPDDTTPDH